LKNARIAFRVPKFLRADRRQHLTKTPTGVNRRALEESSKAVQPLADRQVNYLGSRTPRHSKKLVEESGLLPSHELNRIAEPAAPPSRSVSELRHTTAGANRVECSYSQT